MWIGIRSLEFSVDIPTNLRGKVRGMLGNFNNDTNDDYELPNGQQLRASEVDSERKILENFADRCKYFS